jgi:hypothetical protein
VVEDALSDRRPDAGQQRQLVAVGRVDVHLAGGRGGGRQRDGDEGEGGEHGGDAADEGLLVRVAVHVVLLS